MKFHKIYCNIAQVKGLKLKIFYKLILVIIQMNLAIKTYKAIYNNIDTES